MKLVAVFFAYNRPDLFKDSLLSFNLAQDSSQWQKIIVWQQGFDAMRKVIESSCKDFDTVIETRGDKPTALANINFNRILGMQVGFKIFKADFVLGIEEDSVISSDALVFVKFAYKKYKNYRKFMGVNLGSVESFDSNNLNGYTRLRYGLQGQAGGLTNKAWTKCSKLLNNFDNNNIGWDSRIEYLLKTGFMVTPNISRMNDLGWLNGTHAPKDPNHNHYTRLRENWAGSTVECDKLYREIPIFHSWRADVVNYKLSNQVTANIRKCMIARKIKIYINNLLTKYF